MSKSRCGKRGRKILPVFLIIALVIAAGLGGYSIYGAYKINELSEMTLEEMLAYTTKDNQAAVITIGIIKDGKMTYAVYGENGLVLPQEEHIYEIGSITKTFTTSLLCKAISEGRISLDDSIDGYLSLPQKDYYPTIRRLVTHTSGYKGNYLENSMVSNFFQGKNSFYGISKEMILARLGRVNLQDKDYPFKYSNFGLATIGVVLEQIYDEDYSTLMNEYILEDLGLTKTIISEGAGDLDNYWDWSENDAYIPAGAILSNITDMLKYAQLQLSETPVYLDITHEALAEVNMASALNEKMGIRIDAVGVGWMLDKENNIIWHNGGTGDYNSYIGLDKEEQIGVVVLSNLSPSYRIPATIMGIEILESIQE